MENLVLGFIIGALLAGWLAWLWIAELRLVIQAFVAETDDYMKINQLGDPDKQHNIKRARRVLGEDLHD